MIMKVCPHCGNEIPDNNSDIYCPICNGIVDEEVLLRMKIEKKLKNTDDTKAKPVKPVKEETPRNSNRYGEDDETVKVSEDKNPYTAIIVVVIAVVAAAAYFLLK